VSSPFLDIPTSEWIASNALAFAIRDKSPVSPGHALVVTRRPCETYWDATAEERAAIWELVEEVKRRLEKELSPRPDGFSVGLNAGDAQRAPRNESRAQLVMIPRSPSLGAATRT
jgi:diadenosine tetraphosphate (Ap4A) HIT family hydrolase